MIVLICKGVCMLISGDSWVSWAPVEGGLGECPKIVESCDDIKDSVGAGVCGCKRVERWFAVHVDVDLGIEVVIVEEKVAGCQYGKEFCLENGNSGAKRKGVFFNDGVTVVDEPGPAILF